MKGKMKRFLKKKRKKRKRDSHGTVEDSQNVYECEREHKELGPNCEEKRRWRKRKRLKRLESCRKTSPPPSEILLLPPWLNPE